MSERVQRKFRQIARKAWMSIPEDQRRKFSLKAMVSIFRREYLALPCKKRNAGPGPTCHRDN